MKNKICIVLSLVAALISCSLFADVAKTSFVKKALEPYVKSGELPGAIVVLHDNGVEEVCCAGYADVAAKRAITLADERLLRRHDSKACGRRAHFA